MIMNHGVFELVNTQQNATSLINVEDDFIVKMCIELYYEHKFIQKLVVFV